MKIMKICWRHLFINFMASFSNGSESCLLGLGHPVVFSHTVSRLYDFSPVWMLLCPMSEDLVLKAFPRWVHSWRFSPPVWILCGFWGYNVFPLLACSFLKIWFLGVSHLASSTVSKSETNWKNAWNNSSDLCYCLVFLFQLGYQIWFIKVLPIY